MRKFGDVILLNQQAGQTLNVQVDIRVLSGYESEGLEEDVHSFVGETAPQYRTRFTLRFLPAL